MSQAQGKDAVLTPAGMPTLEVGEIKYGVFFPLAAVKAFAEKRGVSFQEMVSEGWRATDLSEEDLRFLLVQGLNGAERRRQAFGSGPARTIDDDLVEKLFSLYHLRDIWDALLEAWNHGPNAPDDGETGQDPQGPAQVRPDGEASSD